MAKDTNTESNRFDESNESENLWYWLAEDEMDRKDYQFSEFLTRSRSGDSQQCRLCPFIPSDKNEFSKHIQEMHKERERLQCKVCAKEFLCMYKCMDHIKNSHCSELEKEMEKCKISKNGGGDGVMDPYRNCYSLTPSSTDFIYVKANGVISHTKASESDSEVMIIEEVDRGSDRVVDSGLLAISGAPEQDQVENTIAKPRKQLNLEIVDEDGNLYFLNSEGQCELEPQPSLLQTHLQNGEVEQQQKKVKKSRRSKQKSLIGGGYEKPTLSYAQLIYLAFKNTVEDSLYVNEVYFFIMEHFPYYRSAPRNWKSSIRHTLCQNDCFVRVSVHASKKTQARQSNWTLSSDQQVISKMDAAIKKIISLDHPTIAVAMSNPENLLLLQQGVLKKQYCLQDVRCDAANNEDSEYLEMFDSNRVESMSVNPINDESLQEQTTDASPSSSNAAPAASFISVDSVSCKLSSSWNLVHKNDNELELVPIDTYDGSVHYLSM